MKHTATVALAMLILAGLILNGCSSNHDCKSLEAQNAALTQENAALQAKLVSPEPAGSTGSECAAIEAEVTSLQNKYGTAIQELESLEADYQTLLKSTEGSTLRNPTWQELKRFLGQDDTDSNTYIPNKFDCEGFAIKLRDNAWRHGFRAAYVAIGFGKSTTGHALNAFQTADKGLIYVDDTQQDSIAYIVIGKVYGTIVLDGVKEEYINCNNLKPEEFWKPLNYTRYTGNLFAYDYYENYSRRNHFYSNSIAAYNSDVSSYNAAVADFNHGSSTYSYSEMETWSQRLDTWSKNLAALSENLGSVRIEPLDVVESIEMYWD